MRGVKAEVCLQCGSMSWVMVSKMYVGECRVRKDGRVQCVESFEQLEYFCRECDGSALLGIKGSPAIFRELMGLSPMERILRALNHIIDGTLEVTDDIGPDEVLEMLECFKIRWAKLRGEEAAEEFMEKAKEIIGKWKLLE
mgnify:CR=1 FL=1